MSLKLKSHICSSHVKVLCFPISRGKKLLQEMVGWGEGGGLVPPLVSPFPTTLSNVIGQMKKFSNFYRLSSDSLPMFHKLSSMGVFAVEVIFFLLLSKFLCFLHVFKFTGFVMHFGLDTLNNGTFSKI